MIKREKPIKKEFSVPKLYLDDLQDIYEILTELSKDIELKCEDYILDNIKELAGIKNDTIKYFEFVLSNPNVNILCSEGKVIIDINEDTLLLRGIYDKIKQVIEKRIKNIPSKTTIFLLISSIPIILFLFIYFMITYNFIILYIMFAVLFLIVASLLFFIFRTDKTIIYLKLKIDINTFWIRNKDKIIISIFSALLSAIITSAVWYLTNLI